LQFKMLILCQQKHDFQQKCLVKGKENQTVYNSTKMTQREQFLANGRMRAREADYEPESTGVYARAR